MKLEDFIENSLLAICNGIGNAREKIFDQYQNSIIAPGRVEGKDVVQRECVEFDIAITISENEQITVAGEGKIGPKYLSVVAKGDKLTDQSKETINRIKFRVPLLMEGITKSNSQERKSRTIHRNSLTNKT